ncbi:Chromatin assembly complex, subunit 3 [Yamadazyma tenuis]|uniref:Histone-binding protein RBBP4-like N-terminal domain-containing protein n=1 Tax=Candida tenuis (strain ATCC 10573 / BCRC 21748 / CBS 615 / JCM 9827 / NBRC 10315 / NRRL Y-1498 / VKM Y-70) TaxID=590646 RepID=G3BAT0_CANTC|nr:uncharacterized protein CANTEDRAFT_125631 [Yamadazyma tenuis ATCC 10573]EGV62104.1 hypothetical protein CANTEDRAFT_125631 [Yamadazyma tenuis ATCC 10573]WEJ93351.1 Chromatin assembly complex, subunit 3 [Yamadazyma tenuis]
MSTIIDAPLATDPDSGPLLDQQAHSNYRIWKKNTPFLYDYISTHALLWPSMTIQFFPDLDKPSDNQIPPTTQQSKDIDHNVVYQRLLLGTFTSNQAVDSISILQLPYYDNLNKHLNIDKLNYNPDKSEFEMTTVPKKKMSMLQKINHLGDVNKLVYMPQNPDVLVSGNDYGSLVIYDRTKHSSYKNTSDSEDINKPQLTLQSSNQGEGEQIFAVDWNKQKEGTIVSGKMNGSVNIHDIKSSFTSTDSTDIHPLRTYDCFFHGVNDVQWVPDHEAIFAFVDEGGAFKLVDTRTTGSTAIDRSITQGPANTLSFNPQNSAYTVIGDGSGNISVWDIRNIKHSGSEVLTIQKAHDEVITRVKWHPKFHSVFGSSSGDKTVKIFDVGQCEKNNGMVFVHSGHMLGVNDFDWSLHDDWMVGSVADDNSLHVWKPSYDIVKGYK